MTEHRIMNRTIDELIDWCLPTMGLVYPGDLEDELSQEILAHLAEHDLGCPPHVFWDFYGAQIEQRCIEHRRDTLKIGDGSREACESEYQKWCNFHHDDLFKE